MVATAHSIPPPSHSSLRTVAKALTLEDVREHVESLAGLNFPDTVVPLPQVEITDDGLVQVSGLGTLELNSWSRTQLSRMLGIRWDKWFSGKVSPSERKQEIERRLSRESREWKIRARRYAPEETGSGNGILRAFLSPAYAAVDDTRVFSRLTVILGHRAHDLRFVRHEVTDEHSYYVALDLTEVDLGTGSPDCHHNGFIIVNSEVGAGALTLFEYLWRLVCANGLILLKQGEKLFRKVHRQQADESLDRDLAYALAMLPQRWQDSASLIRESRWVQIENPEQNIRGLMLAEPEVKSYTEAVVETYHVSPEPTRFGLVQAITRTAQNLSPDERFVLERFAGAVLAVNQT